MRLLDTLLSNWGWPFSIRSHSVFGAFRIKLKQTRTRFLYGLMVLSSTLDLNSNWKRRSCKRLPPDLLSDAAIFQRLRVDSSSVSLETPVCLVDFSTANVLPQFVTTQCCEKPIVLTIFGFNTLISIQDSDLSSRIWTSSCLISIMSGPKRDYITASEKVVGTGRLLNCGSGEITSSSKCDVTSSSVRRAWET